MNWLKKGIDHRLEQRRHFQGCDHLLEHLDRARTRGDTAIGDEADRLVGPLLIWRKSIAFFSGAVKP